MVVTTVAQSYWRSRAARLVGILGGITSCDIDAVSAGGGPSLWPLAWPAPSDTSTSTVADVSRAGLLSLQEVAIVVGTRAGWRIFDRGNG